MPGGPNFKKMTMKHLYDVLVAAESEPGYEEPEPLRVPKARNATKRKVIDDKEYSQKPEGGGGKTRSKPQIVEYIPIVRGMSKKHKTMAEDFNELMGIAVDNGRVIDELLHLVLDYDPVTRQVLIEKNKKRGQPQEEYIWLPCLTAWKLIENKGNAKYTEALINFVTEKTQELRANNYIHRVWKTTILEEYFNKIERVSIASREQLYFKRPFLGLIPSIKFFGKPLIIYQLESVEFLKVKSISEGRARGVTTLESMIQGLTAVAADDSTPPRFRFNIIRLYHFVKRRVNQYRGVLLNKTLSTYETAAFLITYMGMKIKLDEIGEDMLIDNVKNIDNILNDEQDNAKWLRKFDLKTCDQLIQTMESKIPEYEQMAREIFPRLPEVIEKDQEIEKRLFEKCQTMSATLLAESRQRHRRLMQSIETKQQEEVLARNDPFKKQREQRREETLRQLSSSASRPKPSLMASLLDSVKTLPGRPPP